MVVHHWSDDGMVMYHRRSLIVGLEEGPGVAEDVNKADEERRRREKARSLSSPSVTTPQPLEAGDRPRSQF